MSLILGSFPLCSLLSTCIIDYSKRWGDVAQICRTVIYIVRLPTTGINAVIRLPSLDHWCCWIGLLEQLYLAAKKPPKIEESY